MLARTIVLALPIGSAWENTSVCGLTILEVYSQLVLSSASTRFAERVSYISSSRMGPCLAQDWQNQHDDSWKRTKAGIEIPNKG